MANLTNLTNANNFLEVAAATNNLVGGLFFPVILAVLYVVLLVQLSIYGGKQAFLTASFSVFLLSSILWAVSLVQESIVLVAFGLMVLSVLAYMTMD